MQYWLVLLVCTTKCVMQSGFKLKVVHMLEWKSSFYWAPQHWNVVINKQPASMEKEILWYTQRTACWHPSLTAVKHRCCSDNRCWEEAWISGCTKSLHRWLLILLPPWLQLRLKVTHNVGICRRKSSQSLPVCVCSSLPCPQYTAYYPEPMSEHLQEGCICC